MTVKRKHNKENRADGDKRDMLRWTEAMDDILINGFLHQKMIGNKIDKSFTTIAYDNVVNELRERTKILAIDKEKVKNRLKSLKNNFHEVFGLFEHTNGFTWSPETKLFEAESEAWKALIEAKPEARKWMISPVQNYDKLLLVFGKDRVTVAEGVGTAGEMAKKCAKALTEHPIVDIAIGILENEADISPPSPCIFVGEPTTSAPFPSNTATVVDGSQASTSSRGKKRKAAAAAASADSVDGEYEGLKQVLRHIAEAIMVGNRIAEKRYELAMKSRSCVYSEQEVFAELVNIGIDGNLRYQAYEFLTADATRARKFFGCPVGERKNYLLYLMFDAGTGTQV